MFSWAMQAMDLLWRNALTVVPLALIVAAFCRYVPCRPATRHVLWLIVLLWFLAPPGLSERHLTYLASQVASWTATPVSTGTHKSEAKNEFTFLFPPISELPPQNAVESPVAPVLSMPPSFAGGSGGVDAPEKSSGTEKPRRHEKLARTNSAKEDGSEGGAINRSTGGTAGGNRERKPSEPNAPVAQAPEGRKKNHSAGSAIEQNRLAGQTPAPAIAGLRSSEAEKRGPAMSRIEAPARGETARRNSEKSDARFTPPPVSSASPAPSNSPTSLNTSPARPSAPDHQNHWQPWLTGLVAVRDAVGALPPMPMNFWLGGIGLIVLVRLFQIARFRWRLRTAIPAPDSIRQLVIETANAFGLRQSPSTWLVRDQVSPMIWCGWRTRLLLPAGLWGQLDPAGRKAILCHELAHLRRHDHWVRWGEWVVGALFWWHPVAWWARRQMNEEAELCCDAWVTWLLPRGRRAYAEALLHTKRYVSENPVAVPVAGMGVTTVRAQRFARRITMVMTQSVRPKVSVFGMALATTLLAVSWLAAPVWAHPQDKNPDKNKAKAKKAQTAPVAPLTVVAPAPAVCEQPASATTVIAPSATVCDQPCATTIVTTPAVTVHGQASPVTTLRPAKVALTPATPVTVVAPSLPGPCATPAPSVAVTLPPLTADAAPVVALTTPVPLLVMGDPGDDDKDTFRKHQKARGAAAGGNDGLEERLARLERVVERLAGRVEQLADALESAKHEDSDDDDGEAVEADEHDGDHDADDSDDGDDDDDNDEEIIIRAYRLPKGKLEALSTLMIREDVPVRVAPGEDRITVHGTEDQHEAFQAFLAIIDPSGGEHEVKEGKTHKAEKAMEAEKAAKAKAEKDQAQHGVKWLLERVASAQNSGTPAAAEKALFEAAIAQERAAVAANQDQMRALAEMEKVAAVRQKGQKRATLEAGAAALEQQMRAMEAQVRELEQQMGAIEQHAGELEKHADQASADAQKKIQQELKFVQQQIQRLEKGRESRLNKAESYREKLEKMRQQIEEERQKEQMSR